MQMINTYKKLRNTKVNFYYNAKYSGDANYTTSIMTFLTTTTQKNMDKINYLRELNKQDEKKAKKWKVDNLPCITMSATFNSRRVIGDVKDKTGIIAIDIDKDNNYNLDIDKAKSEIIKLPYVMLVMKSCRGEGLFALICYNTEHYLSDTFYALQDDFRNMGYILDYRCDDITRLRYISYDDNIMVKHYATIYDKFKPREQRDPYQCTEEWELNKSDLKDLTVIIYSLVNFFNYKADEYEQWLLEGFRLATIPNYDIGLKLFHMISEKSDNYEGYKDVEDKFKECYRTTRYKTNILGYYFNKIKMILGDSWKYRLNDLFKEKGIKI